jgi:hypothetical protein
LEIGFRPNSPQPSRPHRARAACVAQPAGATTQWIHGRASRSVSKPDPNPLSNPLSRSFETTFIPFPISFESSRDRVRCKLGKCWSPCQLRSYLKPPIYSTTYSVNFGRKSRSHRTLSSHQIRVFRHRLEQLVS